MELEHKKLWAWGKNSMTIPRYKKWVGKAAADMRAVGIPIPAEIPEVAVLQDDFGFAWDHISYNTAPGEETL